MSSIKFSETERKIRDVFTVGTKFTFEGKEYRVLVCDKPRPLFGECKTDVYLKVIDTEGEQREIKISVKQNNADFVENKMSHKRAEEIFGDKVDEILTKSLESIKSNFKKQYLVCIEKYGKTKAKSIKLGWKFELLNKESGDLSGLIDLNNDQVEGIYSGANLPEDKRNAKVGGEDVENSGVANYILFVDQDKESYDLDECVNGLRPIKEYVKEHNRLYFACKALNYRVEESKWDGDRPLSVYVNWLIEDGKLKGDLVFSEPLEHNGNEVVDKLKSLLSELGITKDNFDNIRDKLDDTVLVYPPE